MGLNPALLEAKAGVVGRRRPMIRAAEDIVRFPNSPITTFVGETPLLPARGLKD